MMAVDFLILQLLIKRKEHNPDLFAFANGKLWNMTEEKMSVRTDGNANATTTGGDSLCPLACLTARCLVLMRCYELAARKWWIGDVPRAFCLLFASSATTSGHQVLLSYYYSGFLYMSRQRHYDPQKTTPNKKALPWSLDVYGQLESPWHLTF